MNIYFLKNVCSVIKKPQHSILYNTQTYRNYIIDLNNKISKENITYFLNRFEEIERLVESNCMYLGQYNSTNNINEKYLNKINDPRENATIVPQYINDENNTNSTKSSLTIPLYNTNKVVAKNIEKIDLKNTKISLKNTKIGLKNTKIGLKNAEINLNIKKIPNETKLEHNLSSQFHECYKNLCKLNENYSIENIKNQSYINSISDGKSQKHLPYVYIQGINLLEKTFYNIQSTHEQSNTHYTCIIQQYSILGLWDRALTVFNTIINNTQYITMDIQLCNIILKIIDKYKHTNLLLQIYKAIKETNSKELVPNSYTYKILFNRQKLDKKPKIALNIFLQDCLIDKNLYECKYIWKYIIDCIQYNGDIQATIRLLYTMKEYSITISKDIIEILLVNSCIHGEDTFIDIMLRLYLKNIINTKDSTIVICNMFKNYGKSGLGIRALKLYILLFNHIYDTEVFMSTNDLCRRTILLVQLDVLCNPISWSISKIGDKIRTCIINQYRNELNIGTINTPITIRGNKLWLLDIREYIGYGYQAPIWYTLVYLVESITSYRMILYDDPFIWVQNRLKYNSSFVVWKNTMNSVSVGGPISEYNNNNSIIPIKNVIKNGIVIVTSKDDIQKQNIREFDKDIKDQELPKGTFIHNNEYVKIVDIIDEVYKILQDMVPSIHSTINSKNSLHISPSSLGYWVQYQQRNKSYRLLSK